jgi:hypothetical protein
LAPRQIVKFKDGYAVTALLSFDEYKKLVELARRSKLSVTEYTKSIILKEMKTKTDLRKENEDEKVSVWPIFISTTPSELD